MKKIPTLFIRDPKNMSRLTREVDPDCEWVMAHEGIATVKIDGTACWWHEGKLWKRYTVKHGRTPPPDFVPTGQPSELGKQAGWTAVTPHDKYHLEALGRGPQVDLDLMGLVCMNKPNHRAFAEGATYELVGPKVQNNPCGIEAVPAHALFRHGIFIPYCTAPCPRHYDGLAEWLAQFPHEGIVWHHPDGRMAKIKRKDFGLPWPVKDACHK